jgi:hypothetical protein
VLAVACQVDHRHPAPAQLALDRVTVADPDAFEDGLVAEVNHVES